MKDTKIAITGNEGPKVRSDCHITLELQSAGGVQVNLNSRVKSLYGESILTLVKDMLAFYDISDARVTIEDSGALPFVIMARMEAAIKQVKETSNEYLSDIAAHSTYTSPRERFRFSRLYLPGNIPSMMLNAGLHNPDGIILDLEDSVALDKKEEARLLVRNALREVNFYSAERMVRINQGDRGIEDLKYLVPHHVHVILIPKCESVSYLMKVEEETERLKKEYGLKEPVYFMPIIESAMGVEMAFALANASENVVSMAIGLEDFTADLGVMRTQEGTESLFARMRLINACKATGIQAIDSVFSDISDMEALRATVKESKALGFEGMGCIHPRQIPVIHEAFAPEPGEIEKAQQVIMAFKEATAKGLGVVSLGSKMIDPPVVKRAEKTVRLAVNMNLIPENWFEISPKENNPS